MFSFTNRIKQFFNAKSNKQISQQNKKQDNRDSLRYSEDNNTKDDDQDSLKYTEMDDNQTINYDWLQQKLQEQLSQILEDHQKNEYRNSLQSDKQRIKKIQESKNNRKKIFQKYKKGLSNNQSKQQTLSIQKQFDTLFEVNVRQSFTSRFLKKQNNKKTQKQQSSKQSQQQNNKQFLQQQNGKQTQNQQNKKQTEKQQIKKQAQTQQNNKQVEKDQQLQKQGQMMLINEKNSNQICQTNQKNNSQVCQTKQSISQIQVNQTSLQKINSLTIEQFASQDQILQKLELDYQNLRQSQQKSAKIIQPLFQVQKKVEQKKQDQKQLKNKLQCVIIKNQEHKNKSQTFISNSKKPLLNFNYVSKAKNNQGPISYATQRPKINFQYRIQNLQKRKVNQQSTHKEDYKQENKHQTFIQNIRVPIIYMNSMTEQRIPIFLQRLRRMNCYLPNLNIQIKQLQVLLIQLKSIIQNINSALTFLQLLFAKIIYKIQALKKFKSYFTQNSDNKDTLQYFLNGNWKSIQELTQIQYVKPKQRFYLRPFSEQNFCQGIKNFRQNCQHYKDYQLNLQTQKGIVKYFKIREIFFKIQTSMKKMSQDLYSLWLVDCHFPYQYKIFFNYLQNCQRTDFKCDQNVILCHIIQLQEYKDSLALSIVGKTIQNNIKNKQNKVN